MSYSTASRIQSYLDSVTSDLSTGIPGLVFFAVSKTGEPIASVTSGAMGLEAPEEPMTLDSVFWTASCTKMITGIACMQLVEQNKLSLDDPKLIYAICPELERAQVLDDSGELVERQGDITLRMLLTHTAGFGYPFFVEKLRTFGYDTYEYDRKEFMRRKPLVHHPGTRWEYGVCASSDKVRVVEFYSSRSILNGLVYLSNASLV
jgi:CubicO group peptidase (beta-lactamase class C family)